MDETVNLVVTQREGAKLAPQAIGEWEGQKGETCALSAAFYAAKLHGLVE